jgi:hypothetical protein
VIKLKEKERATDSKVLLIQQAVEGVCLPIKAGCGDCILHLPDGKEKCADTVEAAGSSGEAVSGSSSPAAEPRQLPKRTERSSSQGLTHNMHSN